MAKQFKFDIEDVAFVRHALRDVTPLHSDIQEQPRRRPPPIPLQQQRDAKAVLHELLGSWHDVSLDTGEELWYLRKQTPSNLLTRLRRGEFRIQAECDLHGLTQPEARLALSSFFQECRWRRIHCVRIIHGKGLGSPQQQPILKLKVNRWLRQRREVLAFCAAPVQDGGQGALYVLME